MKPVRLQLSRRKGFDLQALSQATNGLPAHNVARPGPWGNPFIVGPDGAADQCVTLFRGLLKGDIAFGWTPKPDAQREQQQYIAEHIDELKGKNLACWCRASTPCHADALLELANGREGNTQ